MPEVNSTTILVPLRASTAWFTEMGTRAALERALKHLIVFYDVVALQDGRYSCTITETGSFDHFANAGAAGELDRTKIRYYAPGSQVKVAVSSTGDSGDWHEVLGGPIVAGYEADFYPIISDAGLLGAECFRWYDGDLEPAQKKEAKSRARTQSDAYGELDDILPNRSHRVKVLEALNSDSILSHSLRLPFLAGPEVGNVLARVNSRMAANWASDSRGSLLQTWVDLGLPDFSVASWEHVHAIRESSPGRDLRRMLARITATAQEAMSHFATPDELNHEVALEFHRELIAELRDRLGSPLKTGISLATNLIPFAGVAAAAADVVNLWEERQSWVMLLDSTLGADDQRHDG
jgi:hypothetical protein